MSGATVPAVNRALQAKGINLELVRAYGDGYHYFVYDEGLGRYYDTESVMVPFTCNMTVAQWVDAAEGAMEAIMKRKGFVPPVELGKTVRDWERNKQ